MTHCATSFSKASDQLGSSLLVVSGPGLLAGRAPVQQSATLFDPGSPLPDRDLRKAPANETRAGLTADPS
ncbi:hypothetical protein ElyMa_000547500 [Elysia marginata]|uniref:Uncharacterized protein n=1 Tax=Elysia marginata TaxID=1093978 RepID=A0AAV4G0T0_9GAST|nr:hypothetical protein ElyMa_000547500 [Elysia marginata]